MLEKQGKAQTSAMSFSFASILLYFETCFVPIHCDLRSPLFCLESKTHNFSLVCVIKHIFSLVEYTHKDERNPRGEETCFNNTGAKWIIQIRMTGHALTDSQNRSFSSIVILPAISQERLMACSSLHTLFLKISICEDSFSLLQSFHLLRKSQLSTFSWK